MLVWPLDERPRDDMRSTKDGRVDMWKESVVGMDLDNTLAGFIAQMREQTTGETAAIDATRLLLELSVVVELYAVGAQGRGYCNCYYCQAASA